MGLFLPMTKGLNKDKTGPGVHGTTNTTIFLYSHDNVNKKSIPLFLFLHPLPTADSSVGRFVEWMKL